MRNVKDLVGVNLKKEYWDRKPPSKYEAIHKYEYPGIHIAIFCAVAYINYYAKKQLMVTI